MHNNILLYPSLTEELSKKIRFQKKKYEFFLYEPLIKIKNRYRLIFAFKSRLQN